MSDRNGQDNNIDELLKRLNKMYGADPAGGKPSEKKQKETGSGEMDPELRRMLEQAITDGTPETKQAPVSAPGGISEAPEDEPAGTPENQPAARAEQAIRADILKQLGEAGGADTDSIKASGAENPANAEFLTAAEKPVDAEESARAEGSAKARGLVGTEFPAETEMPGNAEVSAEMGEPVEKEAPVEPEEPVESGGNSRRNGSACDCRSTHRNGNARGYRLPRGVRRGNCRRGCRPRFGRCNALRRIRRSGGITRRTWRGASGGARRKQRRNAHRTGKDFA